MFFLSLFFIRYYCLLAQYGSLPCALKQVIDYFFPENETDIISIINLLLENKYLINDQGILLSFLDIVLPVKFRIDSNIPESVEDLIFNLSIGNPCICLVDTSSLRTGTSNSKQIIIIWGIENGKFFCTDTLHKKIFKVDAMDLLKNLSSAWAFSKMK